MAEIPLRDRSGRVVANAIVDPQDYEILSRYSWHLADGYAHRTALGPGRTRYTIPMHRQVLGLQRGEHGEVDHDNRNQLDNRRSNLKCGSHAANMMNVGANRSSTSRYRGVSWSKRLGKWVASFRGKHIGCFDDELGAARAAQRVRDAA